MKIQRNTTMYVFTNQYSQFVSRAHDGDKLHMLMCTKIPNVQATRIAILDEPQLTLPSWPWLIEHNCFQDQRMRRGCLFNIIIQVMTYMPICLTSDQNMLIIIHLVRTKRAKKTK